jgi:hypothetical protein
MYLLPTKKQHTPVISHGRTLGQQPTIVRIKRNLYDTTHHISRYKQINKSGTLAARLNRVLPTSTNFQESDLREKVTSTGLDTSIKFKLSDANAMINMNS